MGYIKMDLWDHVFVQGETNVVLGDFFELPAQEVVVELLSGGRCGGEYEQACTEVRGVKTCEGVHTQRSRAAGAAGAAWTAGEVEDLVRIERASCI